MKLYRKLFPCLAVLLCAGLTLRSAAATVAVPAETPVIVKLLVEVNSGTHKKGDAVPLEVVNDVIVHGKTVIKAGAPVQGQVESASKRFLAGIGGQIEISVQSTKAVDGTTVPLKFSKETHGGSSLVSIVLTVVCCCLFVFIPGENVKIDNGTIFNATVLGPTEVRVP